MWKSPTWLWQATHIVVLTFSCAACAGISAAATAAASNAFKRVLCIDVSLFVAGGVKIGVFAAISYASLNLAKPKTAFKKDEVI